MAFLPENADYISAPKYWFYHYGDVYEGSLPPEPEYFRVSGLHLGD